MNRRWLVAALAVLAAAPPAVAHTPYGQWVVYRKKHLLIGSHRADLRTYVLAKTVAAILRAHLPEAQARVARAPNAYRLASLVGTDQMDVVVLAWADAAGMFKGEGEFKPYGAIALRLLASLGDRALLAHARVPARHAWLVSAALGDEPLAQGGLPADGTVVPWHPGSLAFREGKPEPAAD